MNASMNQIKMKPTAISFLLCISVAACAGSLTELIDSHIKREYPGECLRDNQNNNVTEKVINMFMSDPAGWTFRLMEDTICGFKDDKNVDYCIVPIGYIFKRNVNRKKETAVLHFNIVRHVKGGVEIAGRITTENAEVCDATANIVSNDLKCATMLIRNNLNGVILYEALYTYVTDECLILDKTVLTNLAMRIRRGTSYDIIRDRRPVTNGGIVLEAIKCLEKNRTDCCFQTSQINEPSLLLNDINVYFKLNQALVLWPRNVIREQGYSRLNMTGVLGFGQFECGPGNKLVKIERGLRVITEKYSLSLTDRMPIKNLMYFYAPRDKPNLVRGSEIKLKYRETEEQAKDRRAKEDRESREETSDSNRKNVIIGAVTAGATVLTVVTGLIVFCKKKGREQG